MAGGVMTCQITGTPVCGKDTLAIIVRQSVYYWNEWVPMSIPSHGCGNDDFLALDPLEENKVNDMFAVSHGYDDMEAMLDDAFIMNNRLPDAVHSFDKETKLPRLPFGIIYINKEHWGAIKEKIMKDSKKKYADWCPNENSAKEWAKSFLDMVIKKNKPSLKEYEDNYRKEKSETNWDIWTFNKDWDTEDRCIVTHYMDHWSEHCDKYSIETYYPIARQLADNNDLDGLVQLFEGIVELMFISRALMCTRENWFPKPSPQEYELFDMQVFVAGLVKKDGIKEKRERKDRSW